MLTIDKLNEFVYVLQNRLIIRTMFGQMWLEHERCPEYFCVSTSYRNESNPVPGKHDKIFHSTEAEEKYGVEELDHCHDTFSPAVFYFPNHTSPFWNMKLNPEDNTKANKIDVDEMRKQF
jgi:hypothetical protein